MSHLHRLAAIIAAICLISACAARSSRDVELPASEIKPNLVLPALEIIGFQAGLNAVDRRLFPDDDVFKVTPASIRRNLRGPWVIDDDGFEVNQFLHPYQGAIYHTSARSSGLNYWQSVGYTFAGSLLWEIAGETTPPSANDQIASGLAGSLFGESLFRTANLLIDKADGKPGPGRMFIAFFLSPPTAVNRMAFGDRFDGWMTTYDPLYDARFQIGVTGEIVRNGGTPRRILTDASLIDVSLEYGLPGKDGYSYRRPFDYFNVRATASSEDGLESVTSHGLLAGRSYGAGRSGRGVWGLLGVYDYISPTLFRVSTTAVALGSTTNWWSPQGVGFQLTGYGGIGWAAAQTLEEPGDYHYGLAPQGGLAMRLTGADRISFDVSGRGYLVSDIGGYPTAANDVIVRGDAALGLRITGRHAVSVRYLFNQRVASLVDLTSDRQRRETIGVFYTLLGPQGFGASRRKH